MVSLTNTERVWDKLSHLKIILLGSIVFGSIILLNSCAELGKEKLFSEGLIEYSITYDDSAPLKYDPSLRPDKMIIKYKDSNMLNRIEGLSGAVTFSLIQNYEDKRNITLIKLMNKKLYYEEPMVDGEFPPTFSEMPEIAIVKTDEQEKFLGFTCSKAVATFLDSTNVSFDILYTKDVAIENPNRNTPFEEIDGVMLKFRVKLYDQNMIVTAVNVKSTKISSDEFVIPPEYERVTKETIYDVIYLLK